MLSKCIKIITRAGNLTSLFILLLLGIISCGNEEKILVPAVKPVETGKYSIVFETEDTAGIFKYYKEKLASKSAGEFQKIKKNKYRIAFGGFLNEQEIEKIILSMPDSLRNEIKWSVLDSSGNTAKYPFGEVHFVAKYLGDRYSLFSFSLITGKTKTVWSKWGRNIVDIKYSADNNTIWLLTASGINLKGSFPLISRIELYRYDKLSDEVKKVSSLGNAQMIRMYSGIRDTLYIDKTETDTINSDFITIKNYKFERNGKKINELYSRNHLMLDGYPEFPPKKISSVSPDERFNYLQNPKEGYTEIYLDDKLQQIRTRIFDTRGSILEIRWLWDMSYSFISTAPAPKGKLFSLSIIDNEFKRQVNTFNFSGKMNFLIKHNYLLTEEIIKKEKVIVVRDYLTNVQTDTITYKGGCGINSLIDSDIEKQRQEILKKRKKWKR